jgi:beta-lactamase regulating signal transducer with metallopeptidase domain
MTVLDVLGWVVLHAAWQAAVVAGVLALFLRGDRASARVRYATAFGSLLFIAALPVVTAVLLATASVDASTARVPANRSGADVPLGLLLLIGTAFAPATKWVSVAWLAGVVVLLVRWGGGWWLVARLTSCATRPARPAWVASLRSAAARLGVTSRVELLESTSVDTPTVIGHRRPVVLLPIPAFEALATAEAESVLAHELAHVRRGDFVANGAQTVVEILFFFHPAVRWLSRTVREERELCCDDVAVEAIGSRVVYARALARLEQVRSSFPAGRLALGADGGTLLRRIRRLADDTDHQTRGSASSRLGVTLGVAVTLACLATVGSLVIPPTVQALAAVRSIADYYTVRAHDPAGEFTITFERGRPTRATVDGIAITQERLVSRGDSLFLPWRGAGHFAVRLKPDGFSWTPRTP